MKREEIEARLSAIALEKRTLTLGIDNLESVDAVKECEAKLASLDQERASLVKQLAELDKPLAKGSEEKTVWRQMAEAMIEKRTVNLAGTGVVNTLKELVKKVVSKTDVLDGVRFFYGKDAATKIPVWGTQLKADFVAEGTTETAKTNVAGVTTIDAQEILSSLPVSQMMLDLGAANLEAELPGLFEEAIADLLADGMCNGKVITVGEETVVAMVGVFTASNTSVFNEACTMVKLGEFARGLRSKKYRNPEIIMSNAVYTKFLGDTSTDETTKIYKEGLIRDKKIEDVSVKLTDYAPSTGSGSSGAWADNDVICVGMDASNYAIGMAGQLNITKKDVPSSTVVYFDANAYAGGKPVLAADVHQYKIDIA